MPVFCIQEVCFRPFYPRFVLKNRPRSPLFSLIPYRFFAIAPKLHPFGTMISTRKGDFFIPNYTLNQLLSSVRHMILVRSIKTWSVMVYSWCLYRGHPSAQRWHNTSAQLQLLHHWLLHSRLWSSCFYTIHLYT